MKKRRLSREFAFKFLYQRDANGLLKKGFDNISEAEFENIAEAVGEREQPDAEFAREIASGVCRHIEEIDSHIERHSENWKISRMSAVDVSIMRMAVYEMLYMEGIDRAVSINEAMEIAAKYGTEQSGGFINGVLDRINAGKRNENV